VTLRFAAICVLILILAGSASGEILIGEAQTLTGPAAGDSQRKAMELAVADLNARGGVLGERLKTVLVDDQCNADVAPLAARKLVAERVVAVFGHQCSSAAIPASEIYEAAGIPMLTGWAVSPRLTEQGLHYVFRLKGRSDREAALAADLLSARYGDKPIAVVHDTQQASIDLASYVKQELRRRGRGETLDEELPPDQLEFSDLISRLRRADAAVLYCACFAEQGGLLVRQLWEAGMRIQVLGPQSMDTPGFWPLAGAEAGQGVLALDNIDWRLARIPEWDAFIARLKQEGIDPTSISFQSYAALQAWAQAAERAKSTRGADVAPILHKERFATVLGPIGFDEKGDAVVGPFDWAWFQWRDGKSFELLTEPLLRGEIVEKK
jgi:branched-chain amino acid transport system substrate-binding protein